MGLLDALDELSDESDNCALLSFILVLIQPIEESPSGYRTMDAPFGKRGCIQDPELFCHGFLETFWVDGEELVKCMSYGSKL